MVDINLSVKQRRAVVALSSGKTVEQAGEIAGVTVRTIYRWMRDGDFTQAVKIREQEQLERISRKLATYADDAIEVLYSIMNNSRSEPQRRLSANNLVEHHSKFRDVTLEQRVAELERQHEHRTKSR